MHKHKLCKIIIWEERSSIMDKVEHIANYIIGILPVDNLKLQKLLYYCQGVHLVAYKKPLFDTPIEAWRYGPVVPNLYRKYKKFGFETISLSTEVKNLFLDKEEISSIDMVLEYFGQMSSLTLVNKTHNEKPWLAYYEEGKNNTIPLDNIQKYFKATLKFA